MIEDRDGGKNHGSGEEGNLNRGNQFYGLLDRDYRRRFDIFQ